MPSCSPGPPSSACNTQMQEKRLSEPKWQAKDD
jgi:hypothetical protein